MKNKPKKKKIKNKEKEHRTPLTRRRKKKKKKKPYTLHTKIKKETMQYDSAPGFTFCEENPPENNFKFEKKIRIKILQ